MPIAVEMPKMTDTMQEGVLVSWLVEEGAAIAAGDVIAQVETDKATMDVETYDDGVLLKRVAGEGDSLAIGSLIAVLGDEGEDVTAILEEYREPKESPTVTVAEASAESTTPEPQTSETGRVRASPLARRMANDHGLDLGALMGSGPEGRIIKRDIEAAMERSSMPEVATAAVPVTMGNRTVETVPISNMRRVIAQRLAASKFTSPHFYLSVDIDMDRAVEARTSLNAEGEVKISYNDLVTKAAAAALMAHPSVNCSYHEDAGEIRSYGYVDIAVAVAIEDGLVTPVLRDVQNKGLTEIAVETRALAERARDRRLLPEEMEGSTFTTSNLGMFGMESFTAIINPPNAAILAIGAIRDVPVVRGGDVVPAKRMKLSLSCDHRVVDGATGARFLATLQHYLEEPLTLLL